MDNQQVIIETFQTTNSTVQTASLLNLPYRAVLATLQRKSILGRRKSPRKKLSFDLDFFQTIDSEAKAYYLGLFKADGYLDKSRNRFEIRLQLKDRELIDKFCYILDLPPTYANIVKARRPEQQDSISWSFRNEQFTSHLSDLKTPQILKRIPSHLAHHFIRGYFDGDGTIAYRNRSKNKIRYQFALVGSPNDDSVLRYFNELVGQRFTQIHVDKRSNLPFLNTQSKELLLDLKDFLYENATIYLGRKHQKFVDMKFHYSTSTTTRETSQVDEDIV